MAMNAALEVKRGGGFTLVELLIAVVVVGVLLSLAAPSFSGFIANQQVKTASNDLFSAFTYARSEAVKRNQSASLQAIGGDWVNGWRVVFDGATLRQWDAPGGIAVSATVTTVSFLGNGRTSASAALVFSLCDEQGRADVAKREVRVDMSGLAGVQRAGSDCNDG